MSFETMSKHLLNAPAGMNLVTMTVLVPVWDATAETHNLSRAGEYVCGSSEDCDVVVPLKGVAAQHCSVYNHNGITTVVPRIGHTVWVNEVAIGNPERLHPGDSLAIGPATFRIDQRHQVVESKAVGSRIDHVEDASSTQTLVDQIQRLEARVAEAEAGNVNPVKSPSAAFEARFLSQLPKVPVVSSRREQDLNNREDELNRRSEMLQQQLAMFKTRHRQQQHEETVAQNRIQEAQAAFDKERQRLLAELMQEAERQNAVIDKKTKLIGQQSEALQRKQQRLEQAAQKVEKERVEQERVLIELEKVREKEQADLQAQRLQVTAELDKLNQSIAEIAQHHHDAQASAERLRTREAELAGFQEELRYRHESVESTAQQLRQQQAEVAAAQAALEQQSQELTATRQSLQSEYDARHRELMGKANTVADLDAKLKQQAAEIEQTAESLRAQAEQLQADQVRDAAAVEQLKAAVEAQRLELDKRSSAIDDRETQLSAVQQQFSERETELLTLQQQLDERDQAAANAAAQQISELREELRQRDESAGAQEVAIADARRELAEKEAEFNEVREQLKQSNAQAVAAAEKQIAELRQELQQRDEAFRLRESELAETRRELAAQEVEFHAMQKQLHQNDTDAAAESEQQLASLREELSLRDQKIVDLEQRVQAQADLDARSEECKLREADVQQQISVIQEQANLMSSMAADLEQQKAALDQQQQKLQAQQARLDSESAAAEAQRALLSESADELNSSTADELQERQAALDARHAELEAWSKELDARNEEAASRVLEIKRLAAETKAAPPVQQTQSVAQSFQFQQEAEQARRNAEKLSSERDQLLIERTELTTALNELKAAFESARDELTAHSAAQPADEPSSNEETERLLSERQAQLDDANRSLQDSLAQNQQLAAKLEELTDRLNAHEQEAEQRIAQATAEASVAGDSETELQLLQQLEELKSELAAGANAESQAQVFNSRIAEYEQTIVELTSRLEEATQRQAAASNSTDNGSADESVHLSIISELKSRLEDQQQTIEELRARGNHPESANSGSVDEAERLHRELDERTKVLDTREGEIRERQRMLEQSTSDIESQRRQLQEARQQLELARAEIQLASEPASKAHKSVPFVPSFPSNQIPKDDISSDSESAPRVTEDSTFAVRSEIAELFGLGEPKMQIPAAVQSQLPAIDDYSQEASAAVSMSFSHSSSVLLEAGPTREEDESVDDGDDFVASYMEQLLARNRGNAGASLPQELKAKTTTKSGTPTMPAPKAPAEKPKAVGQKSFIDAYMSGEYGSDSGLKQAAVAEPEYHEPAAAAAPRARIDLTALRNDMNSFRELSTKSVENALASHAKRQVRGGITTRITVFFALVVVTLFVTCAALMDVIPFGVMCWLAIIVTAASGIELAVKMAQIKKKVQSATLGADPRSRDQVASDAAMLQRPEIKQQGSTMYGPEGNDGTGVMSTPQTSAAPTTTDSAREELDEEYFEL